MTRSTRQPARLDPSLLLDAVEQVGVMHAADDGSHRLELQQALSLPLTSRRPVAAGWATGSSPSCRPPHGSLPQLDLSGNVTRSRYVAA